MNPGDEFYCTEVACVDGTENHEWVVSDEDENVCYCSRCGTCEY
jgi:hypothetical protein